MQTVGPRGVQSVHTISCYKDTWKKFTSCKKKYHKTADEMMNILIKNYILGTVPTKKKILIELKNEIQKRIDQL